MFDAAHRAWNRRACWLLTTTLLAMAALATAQMGSAAPAGQAAPRPPARAAATVDGAVLADGRPLAGARVVLRPLHASFYAHYVAWLDGAPPPAAVAQTTTDTTGAFRLALPGDALFRIEVEAEGRPTMTRLVGPFSPRLPPVALPAGERGTAIAMDGEKRLAGVQMRLDPAALQTRARDPFQWQAAIAEAVTGADGRASLLRPAGSVTWLATIAEGYPPCRFEVKPDDDFPSPISGPGRPLAVEVRDERGRPAAQVLLLDERGLPLARTGADGQANVLLAPDVRRVLAFDAQGRSAKAVAAGDSLRLELTGPRTLAGRTIDGTSRQPLAGVWVWQAGDAPAAVRSDRDGFFRLAVSPPDSDRVLAAAPSHGTGSALEIGRHPEALVVALPPAAELGGRVLDGHGQGIPGARLRLTPRAFRGRLPRGFGEEPPPAASYDAVADAQGSFRFSQVAPGLAFQLAAFKSPAAPALLEIPPLAPRELRGDIALTLTPGVAVGGQVHETAGRLIAGAVVQLRPAFPVPPEEIPTVVTGEDGRYRFEGLAPGRYDLVARADGRSQVEMRGILVPPSDGSQDLRRILLPPAVELSGRIVDGAGRPLAEIPVEYQTDVRDPKAWRQPMRKKSGQVFSAEDGTFTIGGLSRGEQVAIRALVWGHAEIFQVSDPLPLAEPLLLAPGPAVWLRGTVIDEVGEAVPDATVIAVPGEVVGRRVHTRAGPGGRFDFEHLAVGVYQIHAVAEGFQTHTISGFEARPGIPDLRLRLERGGAVEGVVLRPDGEPCAGVPVQALPAGAMWSGNPHVVTDAAGRYRLSGLAPDEMMVQAEHPAWGLAARAVRIERGAGTVRADLRFPQAGVTVSGKVLDADGRPIPAEVFLRGSDGRRPAVVSGADGSFALRDIRPGAYLLGAERSDGDALAVFDAPLVVAAEPVAGLELRLRPGTLLRGQIRGLDGMDMAKVEVRVTQKEGSWTGRRRAAVAFDGTFSLGGLAPGAVELLATLDSRGRRAAAEIQLAPGQLHATAELVFLGGQGALSGEVLVDGRPQPGVRVNLANVDPPFTSDLSAGGDGRFRLDGIPGSSVWVQPMLQNRRSLANRRVVLKKGGAVADFDLHSMRLRGRVFNRTTHSRVAGASVSCGFYSTTTDALGLFDFQVLVGEVKEQTLKITRHGYLPTEIELTLEEGGSFDDPAIALKPAAGLHFEALTPTGPATAVSACLIQPGRGGEVCGDWAADAEGLFRLAAVAPGRYLLSLQAASTAATTFDVDIPTSAPLSFQLARGGLVEATVPALAASGVPEELWIRPTEGRVYRNLLARREASSTSASLADGRAAIYLPAGRWNLTAQQGRKNYHAQVDIQDGAVVAVELQPEESAGLPP